MNTFEITVQRKLGTHWPVVVEQSASGNFLPVRHEGTLQLDLVELTSQSTPRDYGIVLGKAVFRDEVRDAFVQALARSDDQLHVLLFIEDTDLRTQRWERLCVPLDGRWDFLGLNQRVPFSLYLPSVTDQRFPPIGRRDLRALILVASPNDPENKYRLALFDAAATVAGVRAALGEIQADVLAAAEGAIGLPTLDALCERITAERYTLLHIVCHGWCKPDDGETILYLAKADNTVDPVPGKRLLERLGQLRGARGLPQFAFLSACESAVPEASAALGGLAQRLVHGSELGMPAVLAMTEKVSVVTAQRLAEGFYRRLREHGEPDRALVEACAGLADRHDVNVPALYSRLGGRPLFSMEDRPLTNAEVEYGLTHMKELLVKRAPLLPEFDRHALTLRGTLQAEFESLSKEARQERDAALDDVSNICDEALDLSFAALALGQEPPAYDERCPFRGLYPFRVEDREFFFGREALVTRLEGRLAENNFLAVLGPSGSGKSSVVLAGLVPVLQDKEPNFQMAYLTPGSDPLDYLEAVLQVNERASLLIVDQFEELFTLCTEDAKRRAFLDRLLQLPAQMRVVLTMRADFWGECAPYRELKDLMQARQELIAPMDATELRRAMEMQAAKVGLRFEADLSNTVLDDVQGEPGAMPLLQHALLELWKRRHGRWLRAEEYRAIGGVKKAIAETAEAVYQDLASHDQERVRDIFLRLTRPDEDAAAGGERRDTRQRVWLEGLVPAGSGPEETTALVKRLADEGARLLVTSRNAATGREEVEVAHEALIRYWPRLHNWLEEDRTHLRVRVRIAEEAREWEANKKEENLLVRRGSRLEDAVKLRGHPRFGLFALEQDYVDACVALRERESAARKRLRRSITVGLAVGLVVALLLAWFSWLQWRRADTQRLKSDRMAAGLELDRGLSLCQQGKVDHGMLCLAHSLKIAPDNASAFQRAVRTQLSGWQHHLRKLKDRLSHQGPVTAVAYSPDGKTVLTGSSDGTAQLWDAATGESTQAPALQHKDSIYAVAFSPNGKTVLTASEDETAQLWDAAKGTPKGNPLQHEGPVWAVAFSPDGEKILTGSKDKKARLWQATTGKLLHELKHQNFVPVVAYSPDGKTVLTVTYDGPVRLWDADGDKLIERPSGRQDGGLRQQRGVKAVAFSRDGKTVLTGSGSTAQLWEVATGKAVGEPLEHDHWLTSVALSSDGKIALTGGGPVAQLWDMATYKPLGSPFLHQGAVTAVAFSPDGKTILTGDENLTARLWDVGTGQASRAPLEHQGSVWAVAFSPDGNTVLTGSGRSSGEIHFGEARLWDAATGRPSREREPFLHDYEIYTVAFSPDGKTILTGGLDDTGRLWDRATGQSSKDKLLRHQGQVRALAYSPDGKTILTGSQDKKARLWDAATGQCVRDTFEHYGAVRAVALRPTDGKTVLTGSSDATARLWDAATGQSIGKPLRHQGPVYAVAFSPDGNLVLTGSADNTARLWKAGTGQPVGKPLQHQGPVTSVAFSHDGKTILTGSRDRMARLWDAGTGEPSLALFPHPGAITSVAFSPDDKMVLTGSDDGTAQLWDVPAPLEGKVERIVLWTQVITGQEIDENDAVCPLSGQTLRQYRQRLAELGGPPLP